VAVVAVAVAGDLVGRRCGLLRLLRMTNARKMSTTVVTADNSHDTATVITSMPPAWTQTDTAVLHRV